METIGQVLPKKTELLPFAFSTVLDGKILRCLIESPAEDQEYACYLMYQNGGKMVTFHKGCYSAEKERSFDLALLLKRKKWPVSVCIKVFVRKKGTDEKRSVCGNLLVYPEITGPMVSVIIPFCSDDAGFESVIASLSGQKYMNAEYIFIDHGAADRDLALLQTFAEEDRRARIFRLKRQSAGAARNLGLEKAGGEYLIFLDIGAQPHPHLLGRAVSAAEKTHADIVIFEDGKQEEKIGPFDAPYARNKLFRREFLISEGIVFQQTETEDDGAFACMAMALTRRIVHLDEPKAVSISSEEPLPVNRGERDYLCKLSMLVELKKRLEEKAVFLDVKGQFFAFARQTLRLELASLKSPELVRRACRALNGFGLSELGLEEDAADLLPSFAAEEEEVRSSDEQPGERSQCPVSEHASGPKVSVIVPVYNTSQYLSYCLDSVLGSTLRDIEVICLNDGSADDSLSVLRGYQQRDSRIRLVNFSVNHGLAAARNVALDMARGRYICCVDSDDWIEPDGLEQVCAYSEKTDLDILFYDAVPFYESAELEQRFSSERYYHNDIDLSRPRSGKRMLLDLLRTRTYRSNMCLQLYKREFLDRFRLRLHGGIFYEDVLFTFESLLKAELAARLNLPLYHRRFREGSIVTQRKDCAHIRSYLVCVMEMTNALRREHLRRETEQVFLARIQAVIKSMKAAFEALPDDERQELCTRILSPSEALWFRMICFGKEQP